MLTNKLREVNIRYRHLDRFQALHIGSTLGNQILVIDSRPYSTLMLLMVSGATKEQSTNLALHFQNFWDLSES